MRVVGRPFTPQASRRSCHLLHFLQHRVHDTPPPPSVLLVAKTSAVAGARLRLPGAVVRSLPRMIPIISETRSNRLASWKTLLPTIGTPCLALLRTTSLAADEASRYCYAAFGEPSQGKAVCGSALRISCGWAMDFTHLSFVPVPSAA